MPIRTLFAFLAAVLTAPAAFALGGLDVRITDAVVADAYQPRDVVAAADGTLFVMTIGDTNSTVLEVHRSRDGGDTWSLWSQRTSATPGGELGAAELEITRGDPVRLLLAFVDRGSGSDLIVARTDPAAETPVWTDTVVEQTTGIGFSNVRISAHPQPGLPDRVRLAWQELNEIHYASSTSAGAGWSAPIVVEALSLSFDDLDVCADAGGVVHLTWVEKDFLRDESRIEYRRAVSGGGDPSDWQPSQLLGSMDAWAQRVTLAAEPDGDGVVLAAGGNTGDPPLDLFTSSDAGVTWSAPQSYPDVYAPDAAWGSDGPVMAVQVTGSGDRCHALMTPDLAYTGTWSHEFLMESGWINGHLALDPSRGDAPLLIALGFDYGIFDRSALWFDAVWRDAPGYGASDPVIPYHAYLGPPTRPILPGDFDGDGVLELLFSEADSDTLHTLRYYDPVTGLTSGTQDLHPGADYALLDLDGDGDPEPVHFLPDGRVSAEGGFEWELPGYPVDLGLGPDAGWISGGRVTGAPEDEAVVVGAASVWLLGPGGSVRPGFPWTAPGAAGQANGRAALGDVTGDGRVELVLPFTGGVVVLSSTGQVISAFGQGGAAFGHPSLADFNGDGDLEIALPRADGTVHLVHHTGDPVSAAWPYDTFAPGMPSQAALADLAGDARPDLVFMGADRRVRVVTSEGFEPPELQFDTAPSGEVLDPIVDVLGLDGPAVAVGDGDGILRLRTASGPQQGWPNDVAEPFLAPASAADVDADGNVELMFVTAENLRVLDMGVAVSTLGQGWPVSGANVGRTGCTTEYVGATTGVREAAPAALELRGAAPNPFNPVTSIRFRLDRRAENVRVTVHDAAGRLVRTLHRGGLAAGEHGLEWRGEDDHGRSVGSGVYLYRVRVDETVLGSRVVLVK